jgi:Tfp pilus assembly protein PilF
LTFLSKKKIVGNLLLERFCCSGRVELLAKASQKYEESHRIQPSNFQLLYNWGNCLLKRYLNLNALKYHHHSQHNTDAQSKRNFSDAHSSKSNSTLMTVELLQSSCVRFQEALQLQPNDSKALKNYGVALAKLARIKETGKCAFVCLFSLLS